MSRFVQSLVNRVYVDVASSVNASPRSELLVNLMTLLGRAETAAGLSWCWSVVGAGCCVVVLWYLPEKV